MAELWLDFERPLIELERRIEDLKSFVIDEDLDIQDELKNLEERAEKLRTEIFSNLTRWQRVQLARHPRRPYTLDYVELMMTDFIELHGDRLFADDKALIGGLAKIGGKPVVVIGHQKGKNTKQNLARNFGMPHPEGYRKALRLMQLAGKFRKPVLSFIDTPGAYPGIGAEERGQAEAIARNLREISMLPTPIIVIITGEGGSGGALAIGIGDRILMLEYAIYSVISPEGCAAILWKDSTKAPEAAEALKLTTHDLYELGVIDEIVPEPKGGAHRNYEQMAATLKQTILRNLQEIEHLSPDELIEQRIQKFAQMGKFIQRI